MRLFLIAAACATALISNAHAQNSPPVTTPEQRQAQASQLISAASAGEFVVPEDHAPPAVSVRHGRSGLLCRFIYDAPGQEVIIVPSTSLGVAHGDDVACSTRVEVGVITMYATRRSDVHSADEALAGSVAALRRVQPSARPIEVPPPNTGDLQLPEGSRTATFMITLDGREHFTRVSVYLRDGWVYKMRFTSPFRETNALADMTWATTLNDLPPVAGETAP